MSNEINILKKALSDFDVTTVQQLLQKAATSNSLIKEFKMHFHDLLLTSRLKEAYEKIDNYCDLCLMEETAYHKHFRAVMSKHGITGLKNLSKEKKAAFFRDVKKGWHSKKNK